MKEKYRAVAINHYLERRKRLDEEMEEEMKKLHKKYEKKAQEIYWKVTTKKILKLLKK